MEACVLPSSKLLLPINEKPSTAPTFLRTGTRHQRRPLRAAPVSSSSNGGDDGNREPPSTPPDAVEIRFRRGSRRRLRQQQQEASSSGLPKPPPPPKDWDSMTIAEKAIELYMGEKGALFWLNKFAYASIFIIIGGWILFRFVGPSLGLYQLDTAPLSPSNVFKGS